MSDKERERDEVVVANAAELLRPATRRKFVRMMGVGGSVVLLPSVFAACDDDDDPVLVQSPPPPPMSPPPPPPPTGSVQTVTLDLSNDIGILRLVHVAEIIERTFYTAVVTKANFGTLFNAQEQEVLRDLRDVETIHEAFVRNALGAAAVPMMLQFNQTTLNTLLATRDSILNAARLLESTGVSALNGAGKYLRFAENLTLAGKAVSVEARHLAAIRSLQPPAGVNANLAFSSDVNAQGLDLKNEAGRVLEIVDDANVLSEAQENAITIATPPTAQQGTATENYFPLDR